MTTLSLSIYPPMNTHATTMTTTTSTEAIGATDTLSLPSVGTTDTSPITITHPQTITLPTPLEIHPSVDPELARGLMAALTHIERHPEQFEMLCGSPFDDPSRDTMRTMGLDLADKGCLLCHVERLSNWQRPADLETVVRDDTLGWLADPRRALSSPLGHAARIYNPTAWGARTYYTTAGRFARVEHFLRTGE